MMGAIDDAEATGADDGVDAVLSVDRAADPAETIGLVAHFPGHRASHRMRAIAPVVVKASAALDVRFGLRVVS
jgi:hypothetical protein